MTDWIDWLLEELWEEEDQGEDLDLKPYALTRWQERENSWKEEDRAPRERAQIKEKSERDSTDARLALPGTAAADLLKAETEEQISRMEEDREGMSLSLPLTVKREQAGALTQAARRLGTEPEWSWQEGTPAGTGDARTAVSGQRTHWFPAGGEWVRAEGARENAERLAAAPGTGGDLYVAMRRAGTAVKQAQGLQQSSPVVIREPGAMGGQGPTPAELDRIFQRDARRYDDGFTLF